jgi:ATP adenylyltransferase
MPKKISPRGQNSKSKISMRSLQRGIWPQERDIMERPDRYKYVRKIINPEGCVFCDAKNQGIKFESLLIYEGQHAMVVLNKYPYNTGHIMVLPKKHAGEFDQLTKTEYQELSELLNTCVSIVKKEYECQGLNIGLNMGAVAGAGIPNHLHWHIVPRWFGDTNFFPLIAETKALPETLAQSYARYFKHFKNLRKKS